MGLIFKLLARVSNWYNKKMLDAYHNSLAKSSLVINAPDMHFRNTIYALSSDKKIPQEYRKVLSEYLWRTRKQLIKTEAP